MTYSRSPRSHGRALKKIELPGELKTFFGKKGKFIRGLPSYEQIEGTHPQDHRHCFSTKYGFPEPLQETHPVNNVEIRVYEQAQERTRDLLHLFFHISPKHIAEPLREYMLTGGTKPIRVSTHIIQDGIKAGRRVYVKLPSIERVIGLSLYNLISNKPPIDFLFSEYVFVEDSVPGRHMDKGSMKYFQRLPKLPESLVRLAVQDKFIGINDLDRTIDLPDKENSLVNLLVQSDGEVVAFDVDCAFTKQETDYDLVEKARDDGVEIPKEMERRVSKDEARKIKHIIDTTSYKRFNEFIALMDKITSLREQFRSIGFNNARAYFLEREKWLKSEAGY